MQIQNASPLPAEPLSPLESDYTLAVLHLAWDLHTPTKERTLLFAFVELLPQEVPPPDEDGDVSIRPWNKGEHRLFVRHALIPAAHAVEWYLACRRGVAVLPNDDDGKIPHPDSPSARLLKLSDLGEEPPWPNLVCLDVEQDSVPFIANWQESPRVHHLVPLVDLELARLWENPKERENAISFLSEHLHFDIEDYPEYLGSVHLVAPNPVFRELSVRLSPGVPPLESVECRFDLRPGKDATGLDLVIREQRPTGESALSTVLVHAPTVNVQFDQGVDSIAASVIDPQRGMLRAARTPHTFVHSIKLGMSSISATRVIRGPTPEETIEVQIHSGAERTTIGEEYRSPPGRLRLWSALHAREKRAQASAQHQRWFHGQKDEARRVLQGLLHGANREVMIVDPYFAHEELGGFATVVGQYTVPIRVLSSAEVLRAEASPGLEKGEALQRALEHVTSTQQMNPIEIRVMTGSRPDIHDRFLLVDDRVWLLGSSLNEFGSRGTMMVALPDPRPVADQLHKVWRLAEPLAPWVEARRAHKSDIAAEE
jgi:hypothetical protein